MKVCIVSTLISCITDHYQSHQPIPSGKGAWEKVLVERFPSEEKGIKKYFELIRQATGTCMKPPHLKAAKCALFTILYFLFQGQRSQALTDLAMAPRKTWIASFESLRAVEAKIAAAINQLKYRSPQSAEVYFINPRSACAARFTVLGLCACLCVCRVCLRLFSHYRLRGGL